MEELTQRLDKYLANLGISSRRNIKQLLKERVVTVNGKRVRESGTRIDPKKDDIRLNGNSIRPTAQVYFVLNKPLGIISTTSDEYGRKNVASLIPTKERIYPVGRLDKDTSGLILLTNDGELTNLLTHPRYHVSKVYHLTVKGKVTKEQLDAFRSGIILNDGITAPTQVRILKESSSVSQLEVTLHEGKNRQIRRMCEATGIELLKLKRVKFGPIRLGSLKEGAYRKLRGDEVQILKKTAVKG